MVKIREMKLGGKENWKGKFASGWVCDFFLSRISGGKKELESNFAGMEPKSIKFEAQNKAKKSKINKNSSLNPKRNQKSTQKFTSISPKFIKTED